MHFKIRTKLITAFLIMLFATMGVTGVIAWYNQTVLHNAVLKYQGIFTEMELVSHTQLKLDKVLMPGNDYIITGDKRFIKDFEMVSVELEDRIKAVEAYLAEIRAEPDIVKEEKRILEDTKLAWVNIRNISLRIFAIPNPVGNMEAVRLMEEMDYKWSYPAIEGLEKWHKGDIKEYKEAMENMGKVWVRSWVIMSVASVILIISGIFFALFYSRLFTRPIEAIHSGADAIAGGNFKIKLDIKTGDELQQLSGAMNEMAAQLDSMYVNLEGIVEERTRELQESVERYRVLGMTAPNAIICLKAPDTVTFWNRRAEEIFGYSEEEVIGKPMHDLIVPERYREKAGEGLKKFFNTGTGPIVGKKTELSVLRRDGTEFPIELSLSAMNIGGEWQATGIVRDITERKQAEETIKKERDYSKSLLETANAIILTLDTEGRIASFNRYMEELSGYKLDEVKGKEWFTAFLPERDHDRIRSLFKEAVSGMPTKGNVNPILTKDGREVVIEWYANTIKDLDGNITGLLAIGQDVTAKMKTEEKLRQRIDELEQFRKITIKRELRMAALKKRVEELEKMLGIKGA